MALAELPELQKLVLCLEGDLRMAQEVEALISAKRHSRGWPPLKLRLVGTYYRDHILEGRFSRYQG
jgi:hypothetical protein